MKDNYSPVLKMIGQRNATDTDTMVWIAVILLFLPILLLAGNYLRLFIQRRRNRARSYEQLEKLVGEKGLSYPEQMTIENMADAANLNHPAQILSSIETFDRTVAKYMKIVETMPWLEMDAQVEYLANIRQKIGFRHLSPERPPVSTRQLKTGQKIYSLATSPKGIRLIQADIFDVNDLCIFTRPFHTTKSVVKLGKQTNIWGFFWSEGGNEYRFRTRLLKDIQKPIHHLLLKHGDDLVHASDREIFQCHQDLEIVCEWASSEKHGNPLSHNIFSRIETPETLALTLTKVTGSGFEVSFDGHVEIDDLLRFQDGEHLHPFLEDCVGRVVKIGAETLSCRFMNIDPDKHHQLLHFIAKHMTLDEFQKRLKRKNIS